MKKLFWIIPISLVVLFAIVFPLFKWQQAEAKNNLTVQRQETLAVQNSFLQVYGNTAKINVFVEPKDIKIYGANWTDGKANITSICVNGVWVDIAKTDLPKQVQIDNSTASRN